MPRVVKSREEFEGEIFESLVLVEGKDLPLPTGTDFTEIGRSRRRVDGVQRVTGRARYTQDVYLPGMLYARVLRSPYPRARVRRIDTKKAEKVPGVRAILPPMHSRARSCSACRGAKARRGRSPRPVRTKRRACPA